MKTTFKEFLKSKGVEGQIADIIVEWAKEYDHIKNKEIEVFYERKILPEVPIYDLKQMGEGTERKYYTCPHSGETFELDENEFFTAYAIGNDGRDECPIFKTFIGVHKLLSYHHTEQDAINWNKNKFQ